MDTFFARKVTFCSAKKEQTKEEGKVEPIIIFLARNFRSIAVVVRARAKKRAPRADC